MRTITRAQKRAVEIMLDHAERDIAYGWGGTYGGYQEDDKREEREAVKMTALGVQGIAIVREWLRLGEI